MSDTISTTDPRDDVRALMAAARAVVDGYERHIARGIARTREMIRTAERWADEGGAVPPMAQRYAELARAFEMRCRCGGKRRCKICRALSSIITEYSTSIDLEIAALTAFRWIAGERPDLPEALDELSETLQRVTNHLDATATIMNTAYAVAGCDDDGRQVA
jgi:hypothetical protein